MMGVLKLLVIIDQKVISLKLRNSEKVIVSNLYLLGLNLF